MAATDGGPIDLKELQKRTLGNKALVADLLRLFTEHAPTVFARVRFGLDSGDEAEACRAFHHLKGSASTIAATELADRLAKAEAALRAGDTLTATMAMPAIQSSLDACLRQIAALASAQSDQSKANSTRTSG